MKNREKRAHLTRKNGDRAPHFPRNERESAPAARSEAEKKVNGEGTEKSVQRKKRGGGRCRGRAAGAFALPCIPRESSAVFPCAVLAVHALCLPPTLRFIRIHADRCIRAPTDHLKTSRPVSASSMPHAQFAPTQCIRRTSACSAHKKRFHPIRPHCAAPPASAAFARSRKGRA